MALKNLMVAVDSGAGSAIRVDYALRLAERHDAHLTALHVQPPANIPGYILSQIPAEARTIHDQAAQEQAEQARAAFEETARPRRAGGSDRMALPQGASDHRGGAARARTAT